jgi:thiol-disulfide isomerase/thioredoxin
MASAQSIPTQPFGSAIPNLELPDLSGEFRSIDSFLTRRRAGVIVVWSCVCSHCARYDGYLNNLERRYPGVALVAIAARERETLSDIRGAAAARLLTFPILYSGDGTAARGLAANHTPRAYLVDEARQLLYRGPIDNFKYPEDPDHIGYLDQALAAYLRGLPVACQEKPGFGCATSSVYYRLPELL